MKPKFKNLITKMYIANREISASARFKGMNVHLSSCISLKVFDFLVPAEVICSICSRSSFFFTMSELTLLRLFFHLERSCRFERKTLSLHN